MQPEQALNRTRLRTIENTGEERHASWLELFFDLVFVLAVAQVALALHNDQSGVGAVHYVALFAPVWWVWIGYSFYADRFESNETAYRLLMFAAMLAVVALSVNVRGAFSDTGARAFIYSYVLVRALLIVLYLRAAYYVPLARDLCVRYAIGFSVGAVLWLASAFVAAPTRYALWAVGLLVEILTPIFSQRVVRRTPYDTSHVPERFGLFTIIVLGEAVLAAANGAATATWDTLTILAAVIGFAVAAALWWINFEFVEDDGLRAGWSLASQVFLYGHFLIVAGIVAAGLGAEFLIKGAHYAALPLSVRAMLCGGVAVFLIAITLIRLSAGRCPLVWTRFAAIAAVCALLVLGNWLPPLALAALLLATLVAEVAIESRYVEEGNSEDAQSGSPQSKLSTCVHFAEVRRHAVKPKTVGCEECVKGKQKWVHLRLCLTCGHVGCCDSSKNKHATKHFRETEHAVIASLEQHESWSWCYVDEIFIGSL